MIDSSGNDLNLTPIPGGLMRRLQHCCLFLACLIGSLACAQRAEAQGTSGLVTDPMGLREARELIDRYAKLRKEQWPLLEGVHDEYLVRFPTLRDGPVQEYLDELKAMNAGRTGEIPEIEVVRAMFEKGERVNRRIAGVDDEFFRNVTVLLDEDQVQGVARARTARQRQRNSNNQMSICTTMGLGPVDEAYWSLELTDEDHALLEPHLRSYESTMASLTGDRLEAANRSMLNMIEALVELGYGDFSNQDMQDPEKAQAFMKAIQEAMAVSMVGLAEIQAEIDKRELSMAAQFKSMLPQEKAHQLLRQWMSRAGASSMGLPGSGISELDSAYRRTKASDTLQDADREAVESIMAEWRKRDVGYLMDMAREVQFIGMQAYSGGGLVDPETMGRAYEGLMNLNVKRKDSTTTARERIIALLGEERAEHFVGDSTNGDGAPVIQAFGDVNGEHSVVVSSGPVATNLLGNGVEPYVGVSGPITVEDLSLYTRLLQLTDAEEDILNALHAGYLQAWKARVEDPVERGNGINTWTFDENLDTHAQFDAESLERKWGLYAEARTNSLELDEALFTDLAATFTVTARDEPLDAVRQCRAFQRIQGRSAVAGNPYSGMGPALSLPNPYMVAEGMMLDPESQAVFFQGLVVRRQEVAPAIEGFESMLFERARDAAGPNDGISILDDPNATEGEAMARMQEEFTRTMQREYDEARELARRTEVIRSQLESMAVEHLDEVEQRMIPVVLHEQMMGTPNRPMRVMRRVMAMGDLQDDQRAAIEEVFARHFELDAPSAGKLVELLSRPLPLQESMQEMFAARMDAHEQIERIRFRRTELEERCLDRVMGILTPQQSARVSSIVVGDDS